MGPGMDRPAVVDDPVGGSGAAVGPAARAGVTP